MYLLFTERKKKNLLSKKKMTVKKATCAKSVRAFAKLNGLTYQEALLVIKKMSVSQKKAFAKKSKKSKKKTSKKSKKATKKKTSKKKKTTKKKTSQKKKTTKKSKKSKKRSQKKSKAPKKGVIPPQLVPWHNHLEKFKKKHPNLKGRALLEAAKPSYNK